MPLDRMLGQHRTDGYPWAGAHPPKPLHLHLKAAIAVKNGVVGCLIRDGAIPEMWGPRDACHHVARSR